MQSILLPDYLAARTQAQHSFSTCSVTQKTQHAERMYAACTEATHQGVYSFALHS